MVRELPHGPQAVYSIRHLSICGAYDNTACLKASILGPMLSNLNINYLPSAVKSSCTDSHVDDTYQAPPGYEIRHIIDRQAQSDDRRKWRTRVTVYDFRLYLRR